MIPLFANLFSKSPSPGVVMASIGQEHIVKRLLHKKALLERNDPEHEKIRPLLFLSPGGMGGAVEAGVVVALEKLDLLNAFDTVVGISAGAVAGYYALGHESALGAQIIYEDMVTMHFMDFRRLGNIIDVTGFEKILREKNIDTQRLLISRPDFYVYATNMSTGKGELLNVKKASDPLLQVVASMCVPFLDGGKTEILQGKKYFDGSVAHALPLADLVGKFQPTDVVVILPIALEEQTPYPKIIEEVVTHIADASITERVKAEMFSQYKLYNEALRYVKGEKRFPNTNILSFYVKKSSINFFAMSKKDLQKSILDSASYMQKKFTPVE